MKICLIAPRVNFSTDCDELKEFWLQLQRKEPNRNIWSGISTALLTVAALTPKVHEVDFIDENFQQITYSQKYNLVGISAMTQNVLHAYTIADRFRAKNVQVVLGGVHPTLLPEEAKIHADSVVIGEAEYVWKKLINDLEKKSLQPFYHSSGTVDLKDSPTPRFDLLKGDNYKYIWIQTSRGCPHDCEYCVSSKIFGKGFRRKSVTQMLDEVKLVHALFPDKQIFFADDNFLIQKKTIVPVLEKMKELKIRWNAFSDISVGADPGFLSFLKSSGCVMLFIGFESTEQQNLKNIDMHSWKYRQFRNYTNYIQTIQSHGIGVEGSFMVGLDTDDSSIFNRLDTFIIENHLYHSSVTILTPAPGTRLRARLEKQNRILPVSWDKYSGYNVNFIPAKMTAEELINGLTQLYKKIYAPEVFLENMEYFKKIHRNLLLNARSST